MATNEMVTIDQLIEILNVLPGNTYALVNENGVTKKIKLENLINKTLSEVQVLEIEGVPTKNKTLKGALAELSTQIEENKINFVEDDTSMEGIDDTVHDTLETEDKRIIGGINEVNRKVKGIAKKTIVEGNKIYLAKNDGTKLDEGTDLPTSSGASTADSITIKDTNNNFTATDVEGALSELFQNASNGKQLIATAITDKGVVTSSDDTFQTMATNIGKISGGSSITYSITNNLSHAVNNNSNTTVEKYNSYSANITINDGYTLDSVTITMGGTDTTSSCYSNGNISIEHVTGDIVITVTTSVIPPNTYSVTNTLTQCTSNNNSTTVTEGQSYTATITANTGYTVNSIVVKMGNTDISSSAVSGNIITIANVTGNIVITATATQNALYSFGVMSDIHIPTDETSDTVYGSKYHGITKFTNAINKLKNTNIDFLCTTGDLTTYGNDAQYTNVANIVNNLNKPFYSCNGNHDMIYNTTNDTKWNTYFSHNMNYVFTKNNDVFIFMNLTTSGTTIDTPYTTNVDWLETQLNNYKNKRVFLFMHLPLTGYAGLKTNENMDLVMGQQKMKEYLAY